jgi:hypothetical protein
VSSRAIFASDYLLVAEAQQKNHAESLFKKNFALLLHHQTQPAGGKQQTGD